MKSFTAWLDDLRATRVWRSIFRNAPGGTRLHSSLVVKANLLLHLFPVRARRRAVGFQATWYLGAMTFGCFLILVITGLLLTFYYHPSVPQAYADMKDLQSAVWSGPFLRNLHRCSAHAMVVLAFAHMFKVFYRGGYRPPREFNWVIGVLLLVSTLLLSYTGYLLPWDQLAFWAVTVGTNLALAVPLVGEGLRSLLLGGHQISANALLRFYVMHTIALPFATAFLIAVHFWRIRKDGGLHLPEVRVHARNFEVLASCPTATNASTAEASHIEEKHKSHSKTAPRAGLRRRRSWPDHAGEEHVMTYPDVFLRVLAVIEFLAIVLVWAAMLFHAPLEQVADPMHTPDLAKAPWYFLGLQELLQYFPPVVAGVLVPGLAVLALVALPYFNVNLENQGLFLHHRAKRVKIVAAVVIAFCTFLAVFEVWVALVLAVIVAAFLLAAAVQAGRGSTTGLAARPLSYWIMTWFLFELIVLTAVGTFFRGPGWSWVLPWKAGY